jgi:hypothetical protein|nr:MAG: hypothetical protein [Lake Baikal virophage 15]
MVVEASLGFNLPYNKELQERNRLLSHMDVITHNPQLLGGGKLRDYVLPGQSGAYPLDRERLVELQAMGGRQNKVKKTGLAKALRTFGRAVKPLGKTINPLKQALVKEAIGEVQYGGKVKKTGFAKALRTYGRAVKPLGKTINPLKKALVEEAIGEIKYGGKKPKKSVANGRAARAAIVKKVMAEKGLGMIAASSYVKKNGLY